MIYFVMHENLIGEDLEIVGGAASIADKMGIGAVAGLAFLMFNLFTLPCFAAIGAMNAELKSKKWLFGGIGLQFSVCYTVAFVTYFFGTLITGGGFGQVWMPILGWAIVAATARKAKMTAIQSLDGEILTVMIFEEKKIELKDGRIAVFRTPEVEDAEKMLNYIKTACGETEYLLRYPEEWDGASIEGEEKWIKGLRDSQNSLAIACYVDGEIVGNCEISFRSGIKTSHRAGVAIAILKEYWNLGIGSAMFKELISAAEARPEIQIVELEFVEGNDRARALYEKFGFKVVSDRPNAFKLKDGRLLKEYFMQREIVRE